MTGKYQWPASRLSDKEMALLFQEKQKAKTSICELLRRAVNIAYGGLEKKEDRNGYKTKAEKQKTETKGRGRQEGRS
jgi:hypothetical protein